MRWKVPHTRRPADADISDELRAHLQIAVSERVARGESPEHAMRAARLELGNVTSLEEDVRSVWRSNLLGGLWADVRLAVRRLRASPGFTAAAVLTLALGLSVNATVFSLVSSLFLRPLAVKDSDRQVVVLREAKDSQLLAGVSWLDYQDLRSGVSEFADALALAFRPAHLSVAGRTPDRVWIEAVSGNYFSMLGVSPAAGRLFHPEESGGDPAVVLSYRYWQSRLGGDPTIVGRSVGVNGRSFTVIGVASEGFSSAQWSIAPSAFIPASTMPWVFPGNESVLERRDSGAFKVMAHLRLGAAAQQASAAVDSVAQRHRSRDEGVRLLVRPERLTRPEPSFSRFMPFAASAFVLMAGLLLFVACANVANLMLARTVARHRELAVRGALGARRWRLVRHLLAESAVLASLAGVAGAVLSHFSGLLLASVVQISGDVPVAPNESWDWRPTLAAMAAAAAAGAVSGFGPAWRGTRVDLVSTIKGAGARRSGRNVFRRGLVLSQVSVSVVVLAGGALLAHSLSQLASHELGFRSERLLLASVDLDLQGYDPPSARRFLGDLKRRLRALPGVQSVAVASDLPFDTSMSVRSVADGPRIAVNRVGPDYFRTLEVPLIRGRELSRQDVLRSRRVAVINQTLADRLWPGQTALGRQFRWKRGGEAIEVVGIAANGKYLMVGEQPRPFAYLPLAQEPTAPVTIHLRTVGETPLDLLGPLRDVIGSFDPDLPVYNISTMDEHLKTSVFGFLPLRIGAILAGAQGLVAVLLAVLGVYGVVAQSVHSQVRDIGVRLALGAARVDVFRAVARSALRLALLGIGLGLCAALGFAHLLRSILYGIEPLDPFVFGAVGALMLVVSLFSCWLPARRAMHLDPLRALRQD